METATDKLIQELTWIPQDTIPCCCHWFPISLPMNDPESPLQVRPSTGCRHISFGEQLQPWGNKQ